MSKSQKFHRGCASMSKMEKSNNSVKTISLEKNGSRNSYLSYALLRFASAKMMEKAQNEAKTTFNRNPKMEVQRSEETKTKLSVSALRRKSRFYNKENLDLTHNTNTPID